MHGTDLRNDAEAKIRELAAAHHVKYRQTANDVLGNHITRLAGDTVTLDDTELLLLALERAGHVSGVDAVRLHAEYLREARP